MGTSSAVSRVGALITPFVAQVCKMTRIIIISINFNCFLFFFKKIYKMIHRHSNKEKLKNIKNKDKVNAAKKYKSLETMNNEKIK